MDDALLTRVFELAVEARERGDHPFGALLVVDDAIVAEARNRVVSDSDLTAHAELQLVRKLEAAGQLAQLAVGTVYASCEPCPMCVGGMFWAGARHVVFGLSHARLDDLANAPGSEPFGFTISAAEIGGRANPAMVVDGPHREDDAAPAHVGYWS